MKLRLLPCLVLLVVCSPSSTVPLPGTLTGTSTGTGQECSLFGQVDLAEVTESDRAILAAASADYCAVLAGQRPVHARVDASFARAHNGSTARYIGEGYRLLAVRDVRFVAGVPAGVFGSVRRFDDRLSEDGLEVSQLRLVGTPTQH